ncbi:MAG: leucine-rich repeat domain-containing protein, partial [Faecousia sp.]
MKKTVSILLCLLLVLCSASAQAYDIASEGVGVTCGDQLSWALEGSTLYITGTGEMYDFPTGAPWAMYKYSISRVVISDGVTSVGAYAFQDYDSLSSVEFGNSIVSIGKDAFSSCDGLTSITLPASFKKFGENSFRSCSNLKEIHCSGNFPRFDENCLWDTYTTIYFSASNPWSVSLIEQLENA